ncbi:MAG TPA: L-threonylcarbamoyladenylate synthase [Sandaracinaceae bacterium]
MRPEIEDAVQVLRAGGLVAFPTETVYGLGADARNPEAVRRIFAVKGRPAGHPLIVHLPSAEHLERWAARVPAAARELAARFWPGPLTVILEKRDDVPGEVTGGQPTVGLRVPDHPLARELLDAFGGGLAAPSANRFGSVSPTTARHVRDDLGDAVDRVLDGGPCRVGVESTIVDLSGDVPRLLRPGGVPRERIEEVLGSPLAIGGGARAPGTLASHYAPRARVRAVPAERVVEAAEQARRAGRRVVVLGAEDAPGLPRIPLPDEPEERARALYAALREVDARGFDVAVVALGPETGIGAAISDRLRRASAPRPDGT